SNDKKLFIGTVNGGVNILDLKQFFFTKSLSKVTFEHIKAGYEVDQLSHANINSIFHDSYDNVWIATDGGINFYANNNLPFQSYNYNPVINNMNSLSHPVVSGLTIDKNSALWVATYGGGIDVFRNNTKINNYNHSNNVVTDLIISTFADSENNIWFGAYGGKIYRYSLKNKSFNNMSALFKCKSTEVNCFFEDKFKRIYIGTNNGLYIYNYSGNHIEWKLVHNSDNVANMVHALSQDIYGNIWVGTLKGQITIFDKSFRKIRSIGTNSTACINQFYYDSKKRMWVATGENLLMFSSWKNQECDTFDIKQELKNSSVNSITEDSHGQIWLGTNSGICCLNPENKSYVNYDHFDGIPMGDFRVGAVAKSDDGVIYLGSDNGVCYFKPDEIAKRRTFPTASITDFKVIGNMNSLQNQEALYSTINPIQLRYNQNTFTVFFNVLDYSYNNRIEFSYMLEGFENVWYDVQNSKQVTFQNLPPGNYTFHLRSRYKNQQWIDATSNLSISISPPFWLAWWAKVLYTIIVLYTGFYFIRLYKRRLQLENSLYLEKQHSLQQQNLNDERFRFFTNITHELRTPLTLIIGPLEDFVNDMNLHENYKKKITMIYKNASRLLDLVNQILEFRKTETQNRKLCVLQSDLSNQIHEIALKYKELNRNQNVRIQCVVEEGNFELVYDPEVIMIILDNLISNALKYTKKGSVSIGLRNLNVDNGNYIEIEIKDTGCGIEPKTLPHIFDRYFQADSEFQAAGSGIGLAIVKSLVKLHEAEIYVESKLNEGTMFRVRLARTGLYSEASHLQENEPYATESFETKPILLIVEDNQDIQAYITDVFSDSFHVITANNGQEGLEIAIAKSPDIIISDIMMPVMDGIEFCSKIKDDVQTSHISFILLTAKDSIRDKTTGYSVGADSYITKPFSADLLKSRVSNLLESRKKMAASFANSILTKSELTNESMNRLDKEFIIKLTSFVEENIEHEEINIATLTDVVFMSRSTLYRKIKTLTGLSINKFVLKIKMRKAEELIVTGQYTLTEIMSMVGISSSSYFRKCFKDEFNVNPSDYAKKLK
ncbi:MAG: two-component regulator propeller domain-containing protein, partial [Bacteroidota bacterium]|nr:two-component regulator propeller domain-containing protein [Bacteroidota bacterium]